MTYFLFPNLNSIPKPKKFEKPEKKLAKAENPRYNKAIYGLMESPAETPGLNSVNYGNKPQYLAACFPE